MNHLKQAIQTLIFFMVKPLQNSRIFDIVRCVVFIIEDMCLTEQVFYLILSHLYNQPYHNIRICFCFHKVTSIPHGSRVWRGGGGGGGFASKQC